jgi:hypothetical protein
MINWDGVRAESLERRIAMLERLVVMLRPDVFSEELDIDLRFWLQEIRESIDGMVA